MIVTEREAKGKECREVERISTCSASECMGWRWADNDKGPRDADKPRKGFCGKAGYPVEILDD